MHESLSCLEGVFCINKQVDDSDHFEFMEKHHFI